MTPNLLPADDDAILVGRAERPSIGPCLVTIRDGVVIDITTREAPTMRDLLELADPAGHVRSVPGEEVGGIAAVAQATWNGTGGPRACLRLAICRR